MTSQSLERLLKLLFRLILQTLDWVKRSVCELFYYRHRCIFFNEGVAKLDRQCKSKQ